MNIQLSISLLASDRPAALERCLDSLRPLLMRVPSELIIVVTGTDERVRNTAAGYTDQVIPFVWCDNFAAARNAGLRAARGEWFLYIDDDEWFEDTAEICDFFLSGEYRKFGTAVYNQRNYSDWRGLSYSDFQALRLVRLTQESRFVNPIHEELIPRYAPCKILKTYVHHYGYAVRGQKTPRNLPMLLEDIQKHPSYAKNYAQIVLEYRLAGNLEKAEEYCRRGLKYSRKKELLPFHRWLLGDLIEIIYADRAENRRDYQKAEEEILAILQKYRPCEMIRMTAYLMLHRISIKLDRPEQALYYGMQYEQTITYMDQTPELWRTQTSGPFSEAKIKSPKNLYLLRINCVEQALSCGNMKQASLFLSLLPWRDEVKMHEYYPIFDCLKETYTVLFQDILKEFPPDSPYLLFQQVLDAEDLEKEERQKLLERSMRDTQSYHLQYQIAREAVLSEMDITVIVPEFELDMWRQCSESMADELSDADLPKAWNAENALRNSAGFYALLLKKALLERQLIRDCLTGQKFLNILKDYTQCILSYYREQYNMEMFQNDKCGLLPKECRFGLLLSEALQKLDMMEYSETVRLLSLALPLNTAMTGVVREFIRLAADMIDNPASNTGGEFMNLASQMKAALNTMLQNRQFSEAVPVMQQLCVLLPDDLELLRMRQRLFLEADT